MLAQVHVYRSVGRAKAAWAVTHMHTCTQTHTHNLWAKHPKVISVGSTRKLSISYPLLCSALLQPNSELQLSVPPRPGSDTMR